MPVSAVFENLEAGATAEEIAEWFRLTPGQIATVLKFAARSLDAPPAFTALPDTADKNIRYQQNLKGRKIAVIELSTPQWPVVRLHTEKVVAALEAAFRKYAPH